LSSAFTFDLITAMEASTPGSSEDLVLELLEEALKSGMLTEEGTGTRITYHFWHPLLADHLYEGLSAARRASLHRRAATLLIEQYRGREAEGAAVITHHLEQGGADPQLIAHYAELAANRSYTLSSYPEAEKLYRIVLQHFPPDAALLEPSGVFSEEGERRAVILELLGECTRVQGKREDARQFYEQAFALHRQQRVEHTSLNFQYEIQYQALLLCETGYAWYDEGKNDQAWQYYQQAEDVLRGIDVSEGPAWAYILFRQGYVNWRKGEYDKAHERAYEASKLFEKMAEQQNKSSNRSYKGNLFATRIYHILAGSPINKGKTHMLLGLIANGAGSSSAALKHLQEALNLYEQYGEQREIAVACCNLCDVYMRKGDYKTSQAFARKSLSITEKIGELPLLCVIFYNLGVLAVRLGDPEEAEKWYQRSINASDQINNPIFMSSCRIGLVNLLYEQGRFEESKAHLHRALIIGRSINIEPCIGLAMVSLGSLRISQFLASHYRNEEPNTKRDKRILLTKAINVLKRALELGSMEAETKIEGRLALTQAMFLADRLEVAQGIAIQSLNEAQQADSTWLIALAQRVLGNILAARNQREEAVRYIEQALRTFRKVGMRPEYGRTLLALGEILLQQENDKNRQQGTAYLQDARKIFKECKSPLDLQRIDHILEHLDNVVEV
jgi:tetratricopeptide (TPR) repeat protein